MFPGGSWYAVNGWLTWALGTIGERAYAFSELLRNTLALHATAYPGHWDGITSVDDVCDAYYSPTQSECGAGLTTGYEGQVMHQPAWSLFDAIRLAGITPTEAGFEIRPALPMRTFSLGLPEIAVAYGRAGAHGHVVIATRETLTMRVAPPAGDHGWRVYANGRPTRAVLRAGMLVFELPARPGHAASWTIERR